MLKYLLKLYYKIIGMTPDKMPCVQYWKTKESVQAKITKAKDGSLIMLLEGEKYPFPTFPRGHLLIGANGQYSALSILKHQIKQVFNESWQELEEKKDKKEIISNIKDKLFKMVEYAKPLKYDMLPPEVMTPSVREIYRAWTKIAPEKTYPIRDYLTFILQEDDGYRFRVQWLVKYFSRVKFNPVKVFSKALGLLEHGEVVEDMKERQRLLKRILMLCLEDKNIKDLFIKLFREINWNKIKLTKADKYHFRGKYFRVDYDILEY